MQESISPVITTRRRHSAAFKRKLLERIEQPGASVSAVALEHGVNANLVFKWRRACGLRQNAIRASYRFGSGQHLTSIADRRSLMADG